MQNKLNEFIQEALSIAEHGQKAGSTLRLMGGIAVRMHCPKFSYLLDALNRVPAYDLDFMSYGKQREAVIELFRELGYSQDETMAFLYGGERQIFHNKAKGLSVDVFFDEFKMSHTMNFISRLEMDFPTISLADLVLQKLQVVQINEKDIKDLIVLLREHEVADAGDQTIDPTHIAELLSRDWGFYHTATTNLKRIERSFLSRHEALAEKDVSDVQCKIERLVEFIEQKEKTLAWKMRSRIGTKHKWYYDIEEVIR